MYMLMTSLSTDLFFVMETTSRGELGSMSVVYLYPESHVCVYKLNQYMYTCIHSFIYSYPDLQAR